VGEPTGCGLGGDLFALVWDPREKRVQGLNASGRSPRSLSRDFFVREGFSHIPKRGPLAISTPGCVDGWWKLHRAFGSRRVSGLLRPAIEAAEQGIALPPVIARQWAASEPLLRVSKEATQTFLPWRRSPSEGTIFRNPRLGATLRKLVAAGPRAFYEGSLAQEMVRAAAREGCFLSLEDLAGHRSNWVEPLSTRYRGYDVWQIPPNGQGLAVLQMLNLLEGFDVGARPLGSAEYWHLLIEAKKIAYADRARYYADPEFAQIPMAGLAGKAYADHRRSEMDLDRAAATVLPGEFEMRGSDTVTLSVADRNGCAISLIQSNYMGFGSGVMAGELGFMFQNRGTGFSLQEGHANVFEPGKRPFHTIIPGFVTRDGEPWMAFGVMGGDMQPQGQVQVLVNLIDYGLDMQAAGDTPRIEHIGSATPEGEPARGSGELVPEPEVPDSVLAALGKMGHTVGPAQVNGGGYQGVRLHGDRFEGASESRKDGLALGF
jgi:gamma-glutamyltranspeptidase/glutathione hydrolase